MASGVRWVGMTPKDLRTRINSVGLFANLSSAGARRVLTVAGIQMQTMVNRTFKDQRDPVTGVAWPAISGATRQSRPGGGGRGRALVDTAALRKDLVESAPRVRGGTVSIGTSLKYARLHQEGGTLRPKSAKYLWVPLTREARRAGSPKRWMQQNAGHNFTRRTGRGNLMVFKRGGRGRGGATPHFLLLKQVRIPARPFLGWPRNPATQNKIAELVNREVRATFLHERIGR